MQITNSTYNIFVIQICNKAFKIEKAVHNNTEFVMYIRVG